MQNIFRAAEPVQPAPGRGSGRNGVLAMAMLEGAEGPEASRGERRVFSSASRRNRRSDRGLWAGRGDNRQPARPLWRQGADRRQGDRNLHGAARDRARQRGAARAATRRPRRGRRRQDRHSLRADAFAVARRVRPDQYARRDRRASETRYVLPASARRGLAAKTVALREACGPRSA